MNYRLLKEHIGGPHALSRWSVFLAFPLGVAAYFATNFFDDPRRNALHLAAVLLAQTLATLVGLGVWFARRWDSRGTARPLAMLIVFAVIGATRGYFINVFLALWGDPAPYSTAGRVALGVVLGMVGLSLIALATSLNRASREAQANLAAAAARIEQYREFGEQRIRDTEKEVLNEVRRALDVAIVQLELTGTTHPKYAADTLERLSTDVIRPLSHDVLHRASLGPFVADPERTQQTSKSDEWSAVSSLIRPAPLGLQVALFAPIVVLFFVGGMGVTPGAFIALGTIATYTVASFVVNSLIEHLLETRGSLLATLLGALAVSVITLIQATWMAWWMTGTVAVFWFGAVLILAIGLGAALARAHIDWQRSNEHRLTDALRDSSQVASEWAHSAHSRLEHIAHVLHSTVQAELVAQVWQLRRAVGAGSDPRGALIDLSDRLDTLFSAPPQSEPEDAFIRISRLVQLWRSARSIDFSASTEVWEALNASADGLDRVELIIGEALTNAVRHGTPGLLSVRLGTTESSLIEVEVTNPGFISANLSSEERWSGVSLGLQRIGRAAEHWRLDQAGPVVRLTALVNTLSRM